MNNKIEKERTEFSFEEVISIAEVGETYRCNNDRMKIKTITKDTDSHYVFEGEFSDNSFGVGKMHTFSLVSINK